MHKDFYRFKTEPFTTHPNPGIIYISNTHKEAWYYLLFGIDTKEPFLVLTGEYGMGKTLLCLRLVQVLKKKENFFVEYIPTPNEGYEGILRRIAYTLGLSMLPEDPGILQDMIYDYFRADNDRSSFYIVIDDAQETDITTLSKLKHLSGFNHNGFFPFIMIFVAHPSFLQALKTPALSSLNQRIKRRYHLARFNLEDTKNYIFFRMLKSGVSGVPVFPEETLQKIFLYSAGVPRLINNICDTCLLIGASKKSTLITPEIADEARNLVEGCLTETEPVPGSAFKEEAKGHVTIAEDAATSEATEQNYVLPALKNTMRDRNEIHNPVVSGFWKKLRNITILIVLVLLLMLLGIALYQLFFYGNISISHFPKDSLQTNRLLKDNLPPENKPQTFTIPKEMTGKDLQPRKPGEDIPALRDESDDKPAKKTASIATSRADSGPSFFSNGFHPFSLKTSSYQRPERAVQELSEIRQTGLTPYLVKTNLGDMGVWWRIYIGFYATEEEAGKIKSTYNLANASVQKTDYSCLLGEFSNETELIDDFERLKQAGYFPYVIQKRKDNFRLYLGAYEKKSEADILSIELMRNGFNNEIVRR